MPDQRSARTFRELHEITSKTDTRDVLAHATKQAEAYEDYFLVDIDAHVTETQFWPEIIERIDNDVIRHMGMVMSKRPGADGPLLPNSHNTALLNIAPGMLYQPLHGRIPHQAGLLEPVEAKGSGFSPCDVAAEARISLRYLQNETLPAVISYIRFDWITPHASCSAAAAPPTHVSPTGKEHRVRD